MPSRPPTPCSRRGSCLALGANQWLVLDAVRLVGVGAETAVPVGLVVLVVALEPFDVAVALEGQHVGGDAVEEPAIVAHHHGAAGILDQRLFERAQRVDVEVVGRLVEEEQVATAAQQSK